MNQRNRLTAWTSPQQKRVSPQDAGLALDVRTGCEKYDLRPALLDLRTVLDELIAGTEPNEKASSPLAS